MGQALTLPEVSRKLHDDLSPEIIVSHLLFQEVYDKGTFALCEFEIEGVGSSTSRRGSKLQQFIIQVISTEPPAHSETSGSSYKSTQEDKSAELEFSGPSPWEGSPEAAGEFPTSSEFTGSSLANEIAASKKSERDESAGAYLPYPAAQDPFASPPAGESLPPAGQQPEAGSEVGMGGSGARFCSRQNFYSSSSFCPECPGSPLARAVTLLAGLAPGINIGAASPTSFRQVVNEILIRTTAGSDFEDTDYLQPTPGTFSFSAGHPPPFTKFAAVPWDSVSVPHQHHPQPALPAQHPTNPSERPVHAKPLPPSNLLQGSPAMQQNGAANLPGAMGIKSSRPLASPVSSLPHVNLLPIAAALRGPGGIYLFYPAVAFTLDAVLAFSPLALHDDVVIRFVLYGILAGLRHLHERRLPHGRLCPRNIVLSEDLWVQLSTPEPISPVPEGRDCQFLGISGDPGRQPGAVETRSVCLTSDDSTAGEGEGEGGNVVPSKECHRGAEVAPWGGMFDYEMTLHRWLRWELSNFEYLMVLNQVAGRRWCDRTFHFVMPWVIDFTSEPTTSERHLEALGSEAGDWVPTPGWRNLARSKWRLAKGDEQLDFTFASSEAPHHVAEECLSELAVCVYKARQLPLSVLTRTVRPTFEPNEYPSTLKRMYEWSPDECIPELFSDPSLFSSRHAGMADLAGPSFAASPQATVACHMAALESAPVSQNLHRWIDLTFGYLLTGSAAVAAKNTTPFPGDPHLPRAAGRRQLFTLPHPPRKHPSSARCQQTHEEPPHAPTPFPMVSSQVARNVTAAHHRAGSSEELPGRGTRKFPTAAEIDLWDRVFLGLDQGSLPPAQAGVLSPSVSLHLPGAAEGERFDSASLEDLQKLAEFCRAARHLSPSYTSTWQSSWREPREGPELTKVLGNSIGGGVEDLLSSSGMCGTLSGAGVHRMLPGQQGQTSSLSPSEGNSDTTLPPGLSFGFEWPPPGSDRCTPPGYSAPQEPPQPAQHPRSRLSRIGDMPAVAKLLADAQIHRIAEQSKRNMAIPFDCRISPSEEPKPHSNLLSDGRLPDDAQACHQHADVVAELDNAAAKELDAGIDADVYAFGCIAAEVYLKEPLVSMAEERRGGDAWQLPAMFSKLPPVVQPIVAACIRPRVASGKEPGVATLMASSFFPNAVREAHAFLARIQTLPTPPLRFRCLYHACSEGGLRSLCPAAVSLCAATCLSVITSMTATSGAGGGNSSGAEVSRIGQMAAEIMCELAEGMGRAAAWRHILPKLFGTLQGQHEMPGLRTALLKLPLVARIRAILGLPTYLKLVHTAQLADLLHPRTEAEGAAAAESLVSCAAQLGTPITLRQTIMPILRQLGAELSPYGLQVLVGIGCKMGEPFIICHLLPLLRSILAPEAESYIIGPQELPRHNGEVPAQQQEGAMVDALAVLDGLLGAMSAESVANEILQETSDVLVLQLLNPLRSFHLQQCAAKALLKACHLAGPDSTAELALPQLQVYFARVAPVNATWRPVSSPVVAYEMATFVDSRKSDIEVSRAGEEMPPGAPRGAEDPSARTGAPAVPELSEDREAPAIQRAANQYEGTSGKDHVGRGPVTTTGGSGGDDDDDRPLGLAKFVYSTLAFQVGLGAVRARVPCWQALEQRLLLHLNWKWDGVESRKVPAGRRHTTSSAALVQATPNPTSLLIEGIGWSVPGQQRTSQLAQPQAAVRAVRAGSSVKPSERMSHKSDSWQATVLNPREKFGDSQARSSSMLGNHGESNPANRDLPPGSAAQQSRAALRGFQMPPQQSGAGSVNDARDLRQTQEGQEWSQVVPWHWVPPLPIDKGGFADPYYQGKAIGAGSMEEAWPINGLIRYSWRAHSGSVRALTASEDECYVITAGSSARGQAPPIRRWHLATAACILEYSGHVQQASAICAIPGTLKAASAGGGIHIWDVQTGQRLALFQEPPRRELSIDDPSTSLTFGTFSRRGLGGNVPPGVPTAIGTPAGPPTNHSGKGVAYSCLELMPGGERLVAGTIDGRLRFFDLPENRQLSLWRCGPEDSASHVTAIASWTPGISDCHMGLIGGGPWPVPGGIVEERQQWVAAGFATGRAALLDGASGAIVASWLAHNRAITGMMPHGAYQLVTSSWDRQVALWDLRSGSMPGKICSFRSPPDGIAGFALHGNNVLATAGSKLGLATLTDQEFARMETLRLVRADDGTKMRSPISAIALLPLSKFFLLGTHDGLVHVCD